MEDILVRIQPTPTKARSLKLAEQWFKYLEGAVTAPDIRKADQLMWYNLLRAASGL